MSRPVLKVGIVGDIQGYPVEYDWGMHNLERAFAMLAPKQPDVLIMDGDLSDQGDPEAFSYYRMLTEKYFKGKIPVPVACAGNHDYLHSGGNTLAVYEKLCRALGQEAVNPFHSLIAGYDFIAFSENTGDIPPQKQLEMLERELVRAAERDPLKPIFVVTHYPPANTVAGSHDASGRQKLFELFERFPQVVSISGHTHYPLEDERSIWQGEFTAFQTSGLSYGCMEERPFNTCNSILPFAREAVQCLYMEIFESHLEIHRWNVEDGREIKPGSVWTVEIPYSQAAARYTEARKNRRSAPEFPAGTQVLLRYDFGYLYLIFEQAKHEDFTEFYKVRLYDLDKNRNAVFKSENLYVTHFYRLERNQDHRQVIQLPGNDLTPCGRMRAEIYPVESFGNTGKPLVLDFDNPCSSPLPGLTERPQE